MSEKVNIETDDGDYIELEIVDGKLEIWLDIESHFIYLPFPKALELHKAMGKMLGVEDELLEVYERAKQFIGNKTWMGEDGRPNNEDDRNAYEIIEQFIKAGAAIKDAEETT